MLWLTQYVKALTDYARNVEEPGSRQSSPALRLLAEPRRNRQRTITFPQEQK